MPRRKTHFHEGGIYHVGNRGALKTSVFIDPNDSHEFLTLLNACAKRCATRCATLRAVTIANC